MIEYILNLNYITQALIATLFTWGVTLLGALVVFFFKRVNKTVMDALLGFSAGVMIAASFWSLLSPAIDRATELDMVVFVVVSAGFLAGGLLLFISDKIINKVIKKESTEKKNSTKRIFMLISSITIHNIPEGLAVGVAFGSLCTYSTPALLAGAWTLALGIGLQNFPEGSAVSLPLKREGMKPFKAFMCGQLSGIVEPIAGILGAILVKQLIVVLPFLLAFAAGAMIYVVIQELIPESQSNKNKSFMAMASLVGFTVMMILDISLG